MAYRKTKLVEEKLGQARDRILASARKRVERGGWQACTLTQVARDAGLSTGSVYTHYRSIHELYIEVFLSIADEELAVIARIASGEGDAIARLELAVRTFAKRALDGPAKAYAVMAEPVVPEVDRVRQDYHGNFVTEYERILIDGMQTGEFIATQNPRISATAILGSLSESLIKPLAQEKECSSKSPRFLEDEIVQFCLRAVGAKQSPIVDTETVK